MNKKQIEITVTAILALIFILAFSRSIKTVKNKLKTNYPSATQTITPAPAANVNSGAIVDNRNKDERLEWVRCPFSGKVYPSAEGKSVTFKLAGIIWDEKNPQALINNSIVGQGENIGNYRVVKIEPEAVILNDGQKDIQLSIGQ